MILQSLNFLGDPSHYRLRKEIQNICDSYSHPWDILAELCQNSVDAILIYERLYSQASPKNHTIAITVNAQDRSIRVHDTGTGFLPNIFREALAPHGTYKDSVEYGYTVGEKGVGLTYTIFMSNYYEIKTRSTQGYINGEIRNAYQWKDGLIEAMPEFDVIDWREEEFKYEETFTEIFIRDIPSIYTHQEDIFFQVPQVLELWLRTNTAIGNLKPIFENQPLRIAVTLIVVDEKGNTFEKEISPQYMLPEEFVPKSEIFDMQNLGESFWPMDDKQRARKLQGKALVKKGSEFRNGRRISYYAFFAPTRNLWRDISQKNGFYAPEEPTDSNHLYKGGIYIASKGMPSGISLEPPVTGTAGYWPNFYIIFEDDNINFDLGRKSIPNRTRGMLRDMASELFREFRRYLTYVSIDPPSRGGTTATLQQYQKSKTFERFNGLPDLGLNDISYLKHPDQQEAAVVALFHELIGAGILKGYYTLATGFKQTYDMWGIYKIEKSNVGQAYEHLANDSSYIEMPVVIEFKFAAESIMDDLEDNRKLFEDIDMIVCWDFDEIKLKKNGIEVDTLTPNQTLFYGSNFRFVISSAYNLGAASEKPILALRQFIQQYLSRS